MKSPLFACVNCTVAGLLTKFHALTHILSFAIEETISHAQGNCFHQQQYDGTMAAILKVVCDVEEY